MTGMTRNIADRVVHIVATRCGLSPCEITGRSQQVRIVAARNEAIRLFDRQGFSAREIGYAVHRHHSTVLHALGRLACK